MFSPMGHQPQPACAIASIPHRCASSRLRIWKPKVMATCCLSSVRGEEGGLRMTRKLERAVLDGGCFWGMQDLIRKMRGVVNTRVGYTGGNVPNATYRNHGCHA